MPDPKVLRERILNAFCARGDTLRLLGHDDPEGSMTELDVGAGTAVRVGGELASLLLGAGIAESYATVAALLGSTGLTVGANVCAVINAVMGGLILPWKQAGPDGTGGLWKESDVDGTGLVGWWLEPSEIAAMRSEFAAHWAGESAVDKRTLSAGAYQDFLLVKFLREKFESLYMHVPKLEFARAHMKKGAICPVYRFKGYRSTVIGSEGLDTFIKLLLGGAHFLLPSEPTLGAELRRRSVGTSPVFKHSHYTFNNSDEDRNRAVYAAFSPAAWTTNDGTLYPPAKEDANTLCAMLIDQVLIDGQCRGSFLQLEGWPGPYQGSTVQSVATSDMLLHGLDYGTHRVTVFNISTWGLSPYSEKRGTTVIINDSAAPPDIRNTFSTKDGGWEQYLIR